MSINKYKLYLIFGGIILVLVGVYIGFLPRDYLAQFFEINEGNLDSLSEMRGMGGTIFIMGLFLIAGSWINKIENTALIISGLIFGSFSCFRLLGILIDGVPSQSILIALSIEIICAVITIRLLFCRNQIDLKT